MKNVALRSLVAIALVVLVGCGESPPTEESLREQLAPMVNTTNQMPGIFAMIRDVKVERVNDVTNAYRGLVTVSYRYQGATTYKTTRYKWADKRWSEE